MNYADIKTIDIQDGTGVRVSIYVSGCHFRCKGCHNPEAWNFDFGKKYDEQTENYILEQLDHDYIRIINTWRRTLRARKPKGISKSSRKSKAKIPK